MIEAEVNDRVHTSVNDLFNSAYGIIEQARDAAGAEPVQRQPSNVDSVTEAAKSIWHAGYLNWQEWRKGQRP